MIVLDLGDGRELRLPEMSDEAARTFKRAFLAAEKDAREETVRDLLGAVVNAFADARDAEQDRGSAPEDRIVSELRRVREAVLAPREMYPDELGELTRSRAILPKGEQQL